MEKHLFINYLCCLRKQFLRFVVVEAFLYLMFLRICSTLFYQARFHSANILKHTSFTRFFQDNNFQNLHTCLLFKLHVTSMYTFFGLNFFNNLSEPNLFELNLHIELKQTCELSKLFVKSCKLLLSEKLKVLCSIVLWFKQKKLVHYLFLLAALQPI